jgi:proteasome assembly chaperone (PAC2) family protein
MHPVVELCGEVQAMNAQPNPFQLYHVPRLRDPYLVAAWTGMGAVGLLSANYLRQELDAQLCGRIDPRAFFSPTQVVVEDGVIHSPVLPETKLYYWDRADRHDLLFLVGTEQPTDVYRMAQAVVDVAQQLGVQRVYTTAAMPTFIHHSQVPRVWGTATHSELLRELGYYDVNRMREGTIGGLNGLLLAVARDRDMEGLCLLGEIPLYASQMVNPAGAHAVLGVLTAMLDVEVRLDRLAVWAEDLSAQMDRLYELLPDDVKERLEGEHPPSSPPSGDTEQPLVADEAFFDEIERFLDQNRRADDDQDDEETGLDRSAS